MKYGGSLVAMMFLECGNYVGENTISLMSVAGMLGWTMRQLAVRAIKKYRRKMKHDSYRRWCCQSPSDVLVNSEPRFYIHPRSDGHGCG